MTDRNRTTFIFFIKRNKLLKNGEAPIYARIRVDKRNDELSILRSIKPELWNVEKCGATGNSKEAKEINSYLETIRYKLHDHLAKLQNAGREITATAIKKSFLGLDVERTILSIFREHNENVRLLIDKDFAYATFQRYEITMMHVQNFIRMKYRKEDLPIPQIDHEFISGLELYLKIERKCGHNSALKYIKNFKKIIRIALANGWMTQDPFAKIKMTLRKVEKDFLSEEELNAIINKEFSIE